MRTCASLDRTALLLLQKQARARQLVAQLFLKKHLQALFINANGMPNGLLTAKQTIQLRFIKGVHFGMYWNKMPVITTYWCS